MNIFVFSAVYHPGWEKVDLNLIKELKRRGHSVIHAVLGEEYLEYLPFGSPVFPKRYKNDNDFLELNTKWVKSNFEIFNLIDQVDMLVIGNSKGVNEFMKYAKLTNKLLVLHSYTFGPEFRKSGADAFCISGKFYKTFCIRQGHKPETIHITGSVHTDLAFDVLKDDDRNKFCQDYNLDPSKKIAIWYPSSPAIHSLYYQNLYQKICNTILENPKFNLLIKGHPWDYVCLDMISRKTIRSYGQENGGKASWELLMPGAIVCKPEDHYRAIKFCDVGVSINSSVYTHFPLFRKPFILVNRVESLLPQELFGKVSFSSDIMTKAGLLHLNDIKYEKYFKELVKQNIVYIEMNTGSFDIGENAFEMVGIECKIEMLEEVLEKEQYMINDDRLYSECIDKSFFKFDGKACERIADVIESVINNNENRPKRIISSKTNSAYIRSKEYLLRRDKIGKKLVSLIR